MPIRIGLADNRQIELGAESFCIGRDADCEVRLADDPRIKPRHAVVRRTAGRWMVEGTDGDMIQVGTEPPARMRWIKPGDIIRLTPAGPEVTFEPPPAGSGPVPVPSAPQPVRAAPPTASPSPPRAVPPEPPRMPAAPAQELAPPPPSVIQAAPAPHQSALWALIGGGLVACGLFAGLIFLWMSGAFNKGGASAVPPSEPQVTSGAHAQQPKADDVPKTPTPASAAIDPERALYLVIMKNPAQGQTYQLGTAWAAGKRHLVTSAAIIMALEELRDVAPQSAVLSPLAKNELPIVSTKAHASYRQGVADAKAAQSESEAARLELEQNKDETKIEALTQKVVASDEKRFQALERQVDYDVGVIEVATDLPTTLPLAGGDSAELKVGSKLTLAGIPFLRDEYLVDREALSPPVKVPGRILTRMELNAAAGGPSHRWLIKCSGDSSPQQNWSGSAVLNSAGQVVAVYSRPTPPLPGQETKPIASHDTATIERVRELLPRP